MIRNKNEVYFENFLKLTRDQRKNQPRDARGSQSNWVYSSLGGTLYNKIIN